MERLPDYISAFIFDLDGVIFDSERAVYNEWKILSEKYGFLNLEEPYMKCIGVNERKCKNIFLDYYGDDFPYDKYNEERKRSYKEKYGNGNLPLKPGVEELLKTLKEKEFRTAIASSTRTQIVREEVRDAELMSGFDEIIGGDMVARSKPEPDIFIKAAEMIDVKPENCCVIEDSYNGIFAASAAGMFSIMIPDMLLPNDEMCRIANLILDDLFQLNDMIVNSSR